VRKKESKWLWWFGKLGKNMVCNNRGDREVEEQRVERISGIRHFLLMMHFQNTLRLFKNFFHRLDQMIPWDPKLGQSYKNPIANTRLFNLFGSNLAHSVHFLFLSTRQNLFILQKIAKSQKILKRKRMLQSLECEVG
jgi:hypothetical protein